ncbi:hypothetical protein PVAP13_1KG379505 [Panicum virgatum]|uniref:Uncharacterized protein n=1 Tax=Panicum virgatum TaxID=38727 RepID=A0A8T0XL63_PANVG|nr:hypothetical protein PVAP13_1KG379505 [Panicum virgatum]
MQKSPSFFPSTHHAPSLIGHTPVRPLRPTAGERLARTPPPRLAAPALHAPSPPPRTPPPSLARYPARSSGGASLPPLSLSLTTAAARSGSAPPLVAICRPRTRPHHAGSARVAAARGGSGGRHADLRTPPSSPALNTGDKGRTRPSRPPRLELHRPPRLNLHRPPRRRRPTSSDTAVVGACTRRGHGLFAGGQSGRRAAGAARVGARRSRGTDGRTHVVIHNYALRGGAAGPQGSGSYLTGPTAPDPLPALGRVRWRHVSLRRGSSAPTDEGPDPPYGSGTSPRPSGPPTRVEPIYRRGGVRGHHVSRRCRRGRESSAGRLAH